MSPSITAFMVAATLVLVVGEAFVQSNLTLTGCPEMCGKVSIPYPFGFKKGCYYKHSSNDTNYYVKCTHNKKKKGKGLSPKNNDNMGVLNIGLDGQLRLVRYVSYTCYKNGSLIKTRNTTSTSMKKFTISTEKNYLMAIGCDTYAWFEGTIRHSKSYHTGCMTVCDTEEDVQNDMLQSCSGAGCCRIDIPKGVTNITVEAYSLNEHIFVSDFNPCSFALVVAKDVITSSLIDFATVPHKMPSLPVVFDWTIGSDNCSTAQAKGKYLCSKQNTFCNDSGLIEGYRCQCAQGYTGNPYLPQGCVDVDECGNESSHECEKPANCINTNGGYHCKCPKGYLGKGTKTNGCIPIFSTTLKVATGVGAGIIALMVTTILLYWQHKKQQVMRIREEFFAQNGGHLLKEKLLGRETSIDAVHIFSNQELMKATNKYSDHNIIGRGGFGIVYKGVLDDNEVVAIKKSLRVNSEQSEQFINEVILLLQLNNRNVVKLLGCCLESEVPLLVYEFIDNGTLYDHLHDEQSAMLLTWDVRLRIASEVAEVLSYLHTTISTPIIHRDMKSQNILLDKNYTAKVADFGASKLVPLDQEHLATMVQGTCGYLDPEYLQTSELTQKSDVYSFGVILVELLTRRKALSYDEPDDEKCLAMLFLRKCMEDSIDEIVDDKLTKDGTEEQFKEVAKLGQWCLKLKGQERPTMKEVASELQRIRGTIRPCPVSFGDTTLQEERADFLIQVSDDICLMDNHKGSTSNSFMGSLLASFNYGR